MKPRQPRHDNKTKAPKARQPKAPSLPYRQTGAEPEVQAASSAAPRPKPRSAPHQALPSRAAHSGPNPAGKSPAKPANHEFFGARINRRAADRLRSGHLWVYSSDVEALSAGEGAPPALLPVADNRGLLLGTALYSPSSQIALRLISREAVDEPRWLAMLEKRLRAAVGRRRSMLNEQNNACRLCFSEADELPGLVIDKYGDLAILQLLSKGLDSKQVRATCVRVLREELQLTAIVERPDPRVRELEGLAAPAPDPLWIAEGTSIAHGTEFLLNGLKFRFDPDAGQKTGAFLDQHANYAATRDWAARLGATGRALDVCCYQGGFSLHLGQVSQSVTGIDASRASLEVAERNLESNRAQMKAEVDWVVGDAFQILREWSDRGDAYDAIVLDPPAFAKSQRAVEGALRGYKEMNLRALRMLRSGGLLVTCSCSHHVGWKDLLGAVAAAAVDANRRVRLLERRGASLDHPVVLNLPETEYLKCLVLEVE